MFCFLDFSRWILTTSLYKRGAPALKTTRRSDVSCGAAFSFFFFASLSASDTAKTWWHLSGACRRPSSNEAQRTALLLLRHCDGLLTPPSLSSVLHARGVAKSLDHTSCPWGTLGFKEAFVGFLSAVATTTTLSFVLTFFSLSSTSWGVNQPHLALK